MGQEIRPYSLPMSLLPPSWLLFRGEIAALTAAALWAVASVLYRWIRQQISALVLNILKGLAAIVMFSVAIGVTHHQNIEIQGDVILPLALSGVVGIGIGDTAFFNTLKTLGVRRTLLLETLAPPLTAILGVVFLHERLSLLAFLGIVITIGGVAWVLSEGTLQVSEGALSVQRLRQGLGLALITALAQASGILLSRSVFLHTDISPLWSSLIRITAGTVTALVWFGIQTLRTLRTQQLNQSSASELSSTSQSLRWPPLTPRLIGGIGLASFGGTFLGIWLQQTSIKYTLAGIAQTLSATSPLFAIPVTMLGGESVSLRSVLGAMVAILGIGILFFSSVK
jgi:drug/metabolite transporter (DMT)-like permease